MFLRKEKLTCNLQLYKSEFEEEGQRNFLFQEYQAPDSDYDGIPDKDEKYEEERIIASPKEIKEYVNEKLSKREKLPNVERLLYSLAREAGNEIAGYEARQNVIGLLVNEFYNKEESFDKDLSLVTELQKNLKKLDYDLGDSGKHKDGVDGDLGAKTKSAIGNFEQDYIDEIKEMVEQKKQVQEDSKSRGI